MPEVEEVSIHALSVANPGQPGGEFGTAEPETTVVGTPDVGVSVKVPTGPDVTVKVALAESLAPKFD